MKGWVSGRMGVWRAGGVGRRMWRGWGTWEGSAVGGRRMWTRWVSERMGGVGAQCVRVWWGGWRMRRE